MRTIRVRPGFTLLEFFIVVAIIAVIIAVVFPRLFRPSMEVLEKPESALAPGAPAKVTVRLVRGGRLPDENEPVQFVVAEGGGSVSPSEAKTDSAGRATTTWTVGPAGGTRNALTAVSKEGATQRIEVMTLAAPTATTEDTAAAQPQGSPAP